MSDTRYDTSAPKRTDCRTSDPKKSDFAFISKFLEIRK